MTTNLVKNITHNLTKIDYSVLIEQKECGYTVTVCGLLQRQKIRIGTQDLRIEQLQLLIMQF